jgi:hypothetical protein
MASSVAGIEDVEEAKVEVEYDEPTDEREVKDTTTTAPSTANPNAAKTASTSLREPEGAALVDDTVNGENTTKDDSGSEVKQIQMTVAADAPWKDRLWEGSLFIDTIGRHCSV